MYNIQLGCDPELFLTKDGKNVSAHGLIPGTKEAPHKVNNGAVQVDGMAVEFNIDPAGTQEDFYRNIQSVMKQLKEMLRGYEVQAVPVAHFDEAYMKAQPEEALILGCEPDFNAYTGQANPRPNGEVNFRTAGGHVHIGWTKDAPIDDPDHIEACQMLCRELDFMLGVPSLFWDEDDQRRNMYGAPGALRVKPYGVEYRSLSNAWLKDEATIAFVYNQVHRAFNRLVEGHSFYTDYRDLGKRIMENNNRELARKLIEHVPELLGENADLVKWEG